MRYHLWNIGCQMNQADAARLEEQLQGRGLRPAAKPEEAHLVIMNTCVVRQSAENKVLGRLYSLRSWREMSQDRALVVMGCYVGDPEHLATRFPWVDRFLAPSDLAGAIAFVDHWLAERKISARSPFGGRQSAICEMVPISYGCDHYCTYCIVRLRRGPQASRPLPDIVAQISDLVQRGAREITLLGQNVDAYGTDLPGHPDLADILLAIHDLEGLWRIRFLTSHPSEMSQRIIDVAAALPKVCEAWEVPVQSGDDSVLRRMGRGYTVARYLDLIERLRTATPHCAISTDVIVGFPGETPQQFENTVRLLERVRFDIVHVAAYSPRPGMPAANLPNDVPSKEKERRRQVIEELQTAIAGEINSRLLGEKPEVLVDGRQKGRWRGRTRTNKLVFFASQRDCLGNMARPTIVWTGPWSMIGELDESRGSSLGPDGYER